MKFLTLWFILIICFSQDITRVESLTLSSAVQQKLQSISQWLDSLMDASIYDYIFRINRGLGLNLFEGDIIGYNPKHRVRTAITNRQQIWNTRIVPYIIDPSFDSASRKDILEAMDEYHQKTCIKWVPRTTQKDYVHFKQINGCYSNIGRTGGEQDISLMGACLKKGTAVHEMMHALGFWHEQSRPDRDTFVQVVKSNIQDGKEYNFDKLTTSEVDTLGVQYDYGSVMHYSKYAFTKNGNPTIMPTHPPTAEIGQRNGLSDNDILRITKLYGCDIPTAPQPTTPKPVVTKPPQTQPPKTNPPVTQPPHTNPPVTQPPHTNPPVTQPPHTNPPVTQPPHTNTPVTQPPHTNPPVTQPPHTNPPVTQPPHTNPPATQPPHTNPPVTQPPHTNPPVTQPPHTNPPATQPPHTNPPATRPPHTNPPATQPPHTNPPATQTPHTNPPATQPPHTNPPATQPPHTNPPETQLPHTSPPATQPPHTNPPATQPPHTNPQHTSPNSLPPQSNPPVPTQPPPAITTAGWTQWSYWSPCDLQCLHSRYRICLTYDQNYCPGENNQVVKCPGLCKPASSLGCWNMDINTTIPSAENMIGDLTDSYKARSEAVRKLCSNYAALVGNTIFALFDGGKCLTGPNAASEFSLLGASDKCDYRGIGSREAANVYTFEEDIDGQWSPWSSFGRCTRTCGLGRQYRYRRCDNPPPIGNGALCTGDDHQVAICNLGTCIAPIKCGTRFHAGRAGSSGLIWMRDYENFMECEYEIATGDPYASISIFVHQIDIEFSKGCMYDSLMLFDGTNANAPLVGSFCGNGIPGTFESSSNRVYMKFVSDETNTASGFTVFYSINSRSRKACVKPPAEAHVVVTIEGNMVGNRVWYQCQPGYKMVGHSPITCMDQPGFALWSDSFPRCVNTWKRSVSSGSGVTCKFEDSLCGFMNDDNNDLNWTVKRPDYIGANNTLPDLRGNYLYAESNRLQVPGDTGRIRSVVYTSTAPASCLEFMYKMDGEHLAGLTVTVQSVWKMEIDGNSTQETADADMGSVVLEEHGRGENIWIYKRIDVKTTSNFQVIFEAALGEEIGSSVSIDDIRLTDGHCVGNTDLK